MKIFKNKPHAPSYQAFADQLESLYAAEPGLRPNPQLHDYQLTYPPAISLENSGRVEYPSRETYERYALGDLKATALYFHFGFCQYKCRYCHHYEIKTNSKETLMADYLDAMFEEMDTFRERTPQLRKLIYFLGGGTPTTLPYNLLKRFLIRLNKLFGPSASSLSTVEVKPVTADSDKLTLLAKSGFQRINLGVQTLDPELYRYHHHNENLSVALDAIKRARACGFQYINIDILTGLENQTQASWDLTLAGIKKLIEQGAIDSVFIYPYHDDPRSKTFTDGKGLPSPVEVAYSELLARNLLSSLGWSELGTRFFRSPKHRRREWKELFLVRANPSYGELLYHGFGNSSFSVGDKANYLNKRKIKDYIDQVNQYRMGISHWVTLTNEERATRDLTFDLLYSPIVRVNSTAKKYGNSTMQSHLKNLHRWTQLGLGKFHPVFGYWRLSNFGKLVHQSLIAASYLKNDRETLESVMGERLDLGNAYRGY